MLNKDKEYILWLCKRLVYRYNEDPQTILNVESILEKNQTEISFYRETHNKINSSIAEAMNNLEGIRLSYRSSAENTKEQHLQKQTEKTNYTFENLDIDKLLG